VKKNNISKGSYHVSVMGKKKYVNDKAKATCTFLSLPVRSWWSSSPPENFVFTNWEVVFTTAGAFQSLPSKQDGGDIS